MFPNLLVFPPMVESGHHTEPKPLCDEASTANVFHDHQSSKPSTNFDHLFGDMAPEDFIGTEAEPFDFDFDLEKEGADLSKKQNTTDSANLPSSGDGLLPSDLEAKEWADLSNEQNMNDPVIVPSPGNDGLLSRDLEKEWANSSNNQSTDDSAAVPSCGDGWLSFDSDNLLWK